MDSNIILLLPEALVAGLAFLVLTLDLFLPNARKNILPWLSFWGLLGVLAFVLYFHWSVDQSVYEGLAQIDSYSLIFKVFALAFGMLVMVMSSDYVRRNLEHPGEYYGILLFAILASMLMVSASELLTAYIAIELLSFSMYVLVAYDRYNPKSNEAGVKYILLGAFSSAILLYGISQIYGNLGTTHYTDIHSVLSSSTYMEPGVFLGIVLVIAGLGFKIAAVPFHMWAPDVYEGAPLPITAYLSIGSKVVAFALVFRIFTEAFLPAIEEWQLLLIILSVLTMLVGNFVALVQSNLKRLLAYASIGQSGYLIMGLVALGGADSEMGFVHSSLVLNGVLLHLFAYSLASAAVFLCISSIYNITKRDDVGSMAGIARRSPLVGIVLTASFFSLTGLPIFIGFTSKFYLFSAVASQGFLWLSGLAIFASLISLYYYLMVIKQLYMVAPVDESRIAVPRSASVSLVVLLVVMTVLGVYPSIVMDVIQRASQSLLS